MNGNKILQLLLFLCSTTTTPTLLASAGPGESDSQVDAPASSKLAPRASTTILPFKDEQHPEVNDGRTAVIDASASGYSLDEDDTNYKDGTTANTAAAEESTKAKTRESDSLQAADSSGLAPTMQSTAAKKIVKTTEDGITSPSSSSSSSPTSILSKIHPLLLIKAIDAIRRDRVESWTSSSNRRLEKCWDVFTWTSKSGKGKAGKSDEEEEEEEASFLYVQMADLCTFELGSDGKYRFYSSYFLANTYQFTDMPLTEERKLPTGEFFSDFHTVYFQDNEHPNTAFTLVDEDNSDGVVVSALASAFVEYPNGEQGTPLYGYVLDQSDSQASARSLSDVLDGGNEKTYDHCSVFVDNGSGSPVGNQCFANRAELQNAIDTYVSSGCGSTGETACPDIASTYGWPMNSWCVGNVTDMNSLFDGMSTFNDDISSWDVSQVQYMDSMFAGASSFNGDLSLWDISQVCQDMNYMFYNASSFDQYLCAWADKNFPYYNAEGIFFKTGCTYKDTPLDQGGPFCATYC